MKKLLVKFLRFLLRKLSKRTHHEYKMSEKQKKYFESLTELEKNIELERMRKKVESCNHYSPVFKEFSEEELKIDNLYVYHESSFKVDMKNIPAKLIQNFSFIYENKVEFEILLGGEILSEKKKTDVYEELEKKMCASLFEDTKDENIDISVYSTIGSGKKITLKKAKVVNIDAFRNGGYNSKDLCKAIVTVKYESEKVENI